MGVLGATPCARKELMWIVTFKHSDYVLHIVADKQSLR